MLGLSIVTAQWEGELLQHELVHGLSSGNQSGVAPLYNMTANLMHDLRKIFVTHFVG